MTQSRARTRAQTNLPPVVEPGAVCKDVRVISTLCNHSALEDSPYHHALQAGISTGSESSRSIRASTRSCRPGVEAGLAPRNQANISAAAQKKREEKVLKDQAKQKEKNTKSERELAGAKAVGRMLDKRAREEAEFISQLDFIPSLDEEPLATQTGELWTSRLTP